MNFQKDFNKEEFITFLKVNLLWDKFIQEEESRKDKDLWFKTKYFLEITKLWKAETIKSSKIDMNWLVILDILHNSKSDPRITLTKDAFRLMTNFWWQNALIVFHSKDSKKYRLSLLTTVYKWWDWKETSNPRRYSYLLWEWEKVLTPKKYLLEKWLVESYEDLVKRFNVEVVRQEFFDDYLNMFLELYIELNKDNVFLNEVIDKKNIDPVKFTKNLLWKIVFIYFIQKKWWLWVKNNWWDWDLDFLNTLLNDCINNWESIIPEKERTWNFYNDYLEPLFYEAFNKENKNDSFSDYFKCKLPFLNWWLFEEEYNWKYTAIKPRNELFKEIIDNLNTYNFTIYEDDPYDSEIAVDPEMLWKIFEKMISVDKKNINDIVNIYVFKREWTKNWKKIKVEIDNDLNKQFWAFYTPREIVHYMARESLIYYLVNWLKESRKQLWEDILETKIRNLFDLKERYEDLSSKNKDRTITDDEFHYLSDIILEIDRLLLKVKVLDPAIWSGAFPMWVLQEIVWIRHYIDEQFYWKNFDDHNTKKQIIKENIFWVDIEPWAIDIARLRFWLSLVVDANIPEPLPNLEFKFVCANTLVSLWTDKWEFDKLRRDTLQRYKNDYFSSKWEEKEQIKNRIKNYLAQANQLFWSDYEIKLSTYKPFDTNSSSDFFDTWLMFWETKFDIVIWNPPYIKEYDNKNAFKDIKWTEYYMWKMDIWYYFWCIWLDLLRDWGVLSYIAQNNWITSYWAKIFRNKVLDDWKIKQFIDFGDYKVFENAWIQTMIFLIEKNKFNSKYQVSYSKLLNKDYDSKNISVFLNKKEWTEEYYKYQSSINKTNFYDNIILFNKTKNDILLNKLFEKSNFKLLDNEVWQWIVAPQDYLNKNWQKKLWKSYSVWEWIFVLSNDEKNKLSLLEIELKIVKPYYTSYEINRFCSKRENKSWIIYTKSNINNEIENYPNIKNHLDKFKSVITSDNKPYWLHRARKEDFFIWEKIFSLRKTVYPNFSYVDFNSYVSQSYYIIKSSRINLKYLTGLLNSKLVEFWLKYKWKMQWSNYQIDKEPLINIPLISWFNENIEKEIVQLVEKIILNKKNDLNFDISDLERQIDMLVYKLYWLTDEEIDIVEKDIWK